jgi:hypothetical protein
MQMQMQMQSSMLKLTLKSRWKMMRHCGIDHRILLMQVMGEKPKLDGVDTMGAAVESMEPGCDGMFALGKTFGCCIWVEGDVAVEVCSIAMRKHRSAHSLSRQPTEPCTDQYGVTMRIGRSHELPPMSATRDVERNGVGIKNGKYRS